MTTACPACGADARPSLYSPWCGRAHWASAPRENEYAAPKPKREPNPKREPKPRERAAPKPREPRPPKPPTTGELVKTFLEQECRPGGEVPCTELFRLWAAWCFAHGHEPGGGQRSFGHWLRAANPAVTDRRHGSVGDGLDHRTRWYEGLSLKE